MAKREGKGRASKEHSSYSINGCRMCSLMQLQHYIRARLPDACVYVRTYVRTYFILIPPRLYPTHPTTAHLLPPLTSRTFFPASLNVDLQDTCPFSREGMHPGWVTMPQAAGGWREWILGVGMGHWEWGLDTGSGDGTLEMGIGYWLWEWDTGIENGTMRMGDICKTLSLTM